MLYTTVTTYLDPKVHVLLHKIDLNATVRITTRYEDPIVENNLTQWLGPNMGEIVNQMKHFVSILRPTTASVTEGEDLENKKDST
jgi:hypothetical protein